VLIAIVASLPPTIAALAAWRRPRGTAALERIEAKLADLIGWQIDHDREHIRNAKSLRRGGQQ
jgi:hypothetical protein